MQNKKLTETVARLIDEGDKVLASQSHGAGGYILVEGTGFAKWLFNCRHLLEILGGHSAAFGEEFKLSAECRYASRAEFMLAALKALRESLEHGLLAQIEDLVSAEIFDDLLGQADYLESEGYFLAAGVLGRAVLEEHLRNWCQSAGCSPAKQKPTLGDFNMALRKAGAYNVSVMKHVDSMIAVGNDAAHNKPGLTREAVARLLRDLPEFLGKYGA
jgi:hypothetical protein